VSNAPAFDSPGGIRGAIESLGASTIRFVLGLGRITGFGGRVLGSVARPPYRPRRLVAEIFDTGVLSLPIVCTSGIVVGGVLGLQGYNTLVRFGAEQSLGAVVGLTLIRELGPVLTALLVTGRAGSSMALSALFILFAVCGGYLVGVTFLGLDGGIYVSSLESSVDFREDVLGSLLKAWVFGLLVALIATYRGFTSGRSTAEVSAATTGTVVTASVCILIADYVITAFWGV
jgi:phospholipid/cholesterol/gamma-HCH transport system permease protein